MTNPTGFRSIITTENNHWFSRVFWLVAFVVSLTVMIYYSGYLIWQYNYEPDFGIKVVEKPMRDLPFPAVTICSPVFAKNNLASYMRLGSIFESKANFSVQEQNYFAANYQVCNPFDDIADFQLAKKSVRNRSDFDIVKLLNESSRNVGEIMHFCGIAESVEHCSYYFNKILTERGFCYSFNMQSNDVIYNDVAANARTAKIGKFLGKVLGKSPKVDTNTTWTLDGGYSPAHKDGQVPYRAIKRNRFGLILSLSYEDTHNVCPVIGMVYRVIFHMPNEIPTIFHIEHFAAFTYQRSYFVTAESFRANNELRKYSPQIRGCFFQNERTLKFYKTYTKSQCDYECLTNYTLESCGCVKFSMPHEPGTPLCDIDQMKCVAHAMDRWPEENDENAIACNCLQTCNYIKYSLRYEKEAAIDYVKDLLGAEHKARNLTDTVISMRFVEHLALEHQKFISYSLENFIADVGGLLGLFMGASLVSFLEFFYGGVQFLIAKLKKRQTVENVEANDARMQAIKIQKLSQIVQILDHKQRESNVKIVNLEERIEKLKSVRGKNDEILMSLEEIIYKSRQH